MTPYLLDDRLSARTLEAEKAVLGGVLVDPSRYDDAAEVLGADDWFRLAHRLIWTAIGRLVKAGAPIDLLTIKGALTADELDEVGGAAYLARLMDGVPRASNVSAYAQQVRDYALRRAVAATASTLLAAVEAGEEDGATLLARGETALLGLRGTQPGTTVTGAAARASGIFDALEAAAAGKRRGATTGLREIDSMTVGFRPGQLVVLGARPSQGKTALALNFAVGVAASTGPVLFCSLEMSESQISLRELALRSGIPHEVLDAGRVGTWDGAKLNAGVEGVAEGRIAVLDKPGATLGQIRAAARRMAAGPDRLALVIVDYLQLMRSERGERAENRNLEVSQFSAGLKQIARELSVPVIALSQLSRESERRADKRPILADLRESGALEQDADIVLLLHRPGVYERNPDDDRAEVIVAKQRNGPTGIAHLRFNADTMRFTDPIGVVARA